MFSAKKVGEQISALRKAKGLTQSELGERLNISYQAVSKWERAESMPDISVLVELATALETTTDNILNGGGPLLSYSRKVSVKDVKKALNSLREMGELLGRDNIFYIGAIEGINNKMNIDFEEYIKEEYTYEALIAEATIQCIRCGAYVDLSDIKREFKNEHWVETVQKFAKDFGIA